MYTFSIQKYNPKRFYKNKRTLVTGATGFIGSFLVEQLLDFGARVTIVVRKSSDFWRIQHIKNSVGIIRASLHDARLTTMFQKARPEIVFNLAVNIGNRAMADLQNTFQVDILGTLNLLNAAAASKVKKFIHIGSMDEYGQNQAPFVESQRENPITPYAVGKVFASHLVLYFNRISALKSCVLRPAATYGPRQSFTALIPNLIRSCIQGKDFPMNPGLQTRDFVYIDDIIDGILRAGSNPLVNGMIINLGSNHPRLVRSIARFINKSMGKQIRIRFGVQPYRPLDNMRQYMNSNMAKRILGWKANTKIEVGIGKTIDWYLKNRS